MKDLPILIVTGLSGSGKSTVIKALEDIGFFCLDNMPIVLLPKFLELQVPSYGSEINKVAIVMDIRGGEFLKESPEIIEGLRAQGYNIEIVYLECSDEVLLRRFNETRRTHPLARGRPILDGIREERRMLEGLKSRADIIIDTSGYNVHQLKDIITQYWQKAPLRKKMTVFLLSFGFKHDFPPHCDLMIDVRFLPNPYFVEQLKAKTGSDPEVIDFIMKREETRIFLDRFCNLIEYLLPLYEREGKSNLTIAIGCTGGRHRSVTIADELRQYFDRKGYPVTVRHRDIHKD